MVKKKNQSFEFLVQHTTGKKYEYKFMWFYIYTLQRG